MCVNGGDDKLVLNDGTERDENPDVGIKTARIRRLSCFDSFTFSIRFEL